MSLGFKFLALGFGFYVSNMVSIVELRLVEFSILNFNSKIFLL